MSGICGIITPACLPEGKRHISNMLDALKHRGQDGRGQAQPLDNVFLGCVHQADIDTQPDEPQPLVDPDTGNILLFNGEIYNFKDLQAKLTKIGKAFATGSDAEVLLMAYAQWGVHCLPKLRGVFAFAIWDAKEHKLFAARDAMGVMPFYYYQDGFHFIFASEVRAILASGRIKKDLDKSGLESLLTYGSLQEPYTLVKGVRSLPAGSYFELKSRESLVCRPFTQDDYTPWDIPEKHITDILHSNLLAAIQMYSFADVQKCLLFDGGISSIIMASLMKEAKIDMPAYFVSLHPEDLQEGRHDLAKKLKLNYKMLRVPEEEIRNNFTKAQDSYDQPSTRGLETWYVTQAIAQQGMHVCLSSLGFRHLFIPDTRLETIRLWSRKAYFTRLCPRWLLSLNNSIFNSEKSRLIYRLGCSTYHPYFLYRILLNNENRNTLMNSTSMVRNKWLNLMTANLHTEPFEKDIVNTTSYLELNTFLRSSLLRNADQLGVANGIEIRMPFLDTIVVNTLLKTPGALKSNTKIPYQLILNATGVSNDLVSMVQQRSSFPVQNYMDKLCSEEIDDLFHIPPKDCMKSVDLVSLWDEYQKGNCPWQNIWVIYQALRWIAKYL